MKCPKCLSDNTKVIDSRSVKNGFSIRRRRQCNSCNHRYTTYEYIESASLRIIKKDGTREEYDRNKLVKGIVIACQKRPVSTSTLEENINLIENKLFEKNKLEISSRELGKIVMDMLRELDKVAYIRFASVYRDFKDISDFKETVEEISNEDSNI